ncbi:prepilin-type N-terminal cleavage/methylation domain-containing protein [Yersinia enterocolitica]|nr:prepilin-type N-terminal cleavage/methylation domain-containing protein [Yersinia enterocolitica]
MTNQRGFTLIELMVIKYAYI